MKLSHLKEVKFYKCLSSLQKHYQIAIETIKSRTNRSTDLKLPSEKLVLKSNEKSTPLKELLINRKHQPLTSQRERLAKSYLGFSLQQPSVTPLLTNLWKLKRVPPTFKNAFFKLMFGVYPDKYTKFGQNRAPDPFCNYCETELETHEQLFFECNVLNEIRKNFKIHFWQDIFGRNHKISLRKTLHFACPPLLDFSSTAHKTLNFYHDSLNFISIKNY